MEVLKVNPVPKGCCVSRTLAKGRGTCRLFSLGIDEVITAERHDRRHLWALLCGRVDFCSGEKILHLSSGVLVSFDREEEYSLSTADGAELLMLEMEE